MLPADQHHDSPEHAASLKHMAHDALHDLLHFDAKLFNTLPPLLFKPGLITEKTLGGESGYVKPFTLFVFANFVFFLVKSKALFHYTLLSYGDGERVTRVIAAKLQDLQISLPTLEERFNTAMRFEQKEYLIIMVPLFALLLKALYAFRKKPYALHLIFSLNFYSWFILYLMLLPLPFLLLAWALRTLALRGRALYSEDALVVTILVSCLAYLVVALRRVYKDQWWLAGVKAVALSVGVILLIVYVYRPFLFYAVMHSMGE